MAPYSDAFCVASGVGQTDSQNWVREHGHSVHAALAPPSQQELYDKQRAHYTVPRTSSIDPIELDPFNKAMDIFRQSAKDKALRDLDLVGAHSWDEVIQQYLSAQSKYDSKAAGWRGLCRRLGRWTGDNAPAADALIKFIPQGTYTSVLSSGLYLIFGAADRMSSRRRQILEYLDEVPFAIADAEECCQIFPNDLALDANRTELYLAILGAIMNMMEWLLEKSGWKHVKALLQGPRYAASLDDNIAKVRKQSKYFQNRVSLLARKATARIDLATQRTEQHVDRLTVTASRTDSTTRRIDLQVERLNATTEDINTNLNISQMSLEGRLDEIKDGQKQFQALLQEQLRNAEWNKKKWREAQRQLALATSQLKQAQIKAQYRGMVLDSKQLLKLLAVDPDEYSRDLEVNLRHGRTLEPSLQNRGQLLMQSPEFRPWLSAASSRCLFVDDHSYSAAQRISAMSFGCALVIDGLKDESVFNIQHFCGLHTGLDDPLRGPRGVLRSLLAQLARLESFHVSFVDLEKFEELRHFDARYLCGLFVDLIKQLPAGDVLFCIVDGISLLYANDDSLEETRLILRTLYNLACDNDVHAIFKVMVTSPLANICLEMEIPPQDYLALRQGSRNTERDPLTRRRLLMQSQRAQYDCGGHSSSDSDEGFVDGDEEEDTGGDFYEGDLNDGES